MRRVVASIWFWLAMSFWMSMILVIFGLASKVHPVCLLLFIPWVYFSETFGRSVMKVHAKIYPEYYAASLLKQPEGTLYSERKSKRNEGGHR